MVSGQKTSRNLECRASDRIRVSKRELAELDTPIKVYNFFNSRIRNRISQEELREINELRFSIAREYEDLQPIMVRAYMRKYAVEKRDDRAKKLYEVLSERLNEMSS